MLMNSVFHVDLPQKATSPQNTAIWRWITRLALAAILLFVTHAGLRAISEAFDSGAFPEALAVKVELLPLIFPLHMITGGLSLLLVPTTIFLRGTRFHKVAGRMAAVDIMVAGLTAPFVAWAAPVTLVSAAGFTAQSMVWMGLLATGVWNIRRGNVAAHQNCMILMAAVTSGALFFRIYLALWSRFGDSHYFKTFYAGNAWIAWGLPLIVAAALVTFRPLAAQRRLRL